MEWILKKWKEIVIVFVLLGAAATFWEEIQDFWYDFRNPSAADVEEDSFEEGDVASEEADDESDRRERRTSRMNEMDGTSSLSNEAGAKRGGGSSGVGSGNRARGVVEKARE